MGKYTQMAADMARFVTDMAEKEKGIIHDANTTQAIGVFFEKELESKKPTPWKQLYQENTYVQDVAQDSSDPEGSRTVGYEVMDRVGLAKLIGRKAQDIPRVAVYLVEYFQKVHRYAMGYGWDVFELIEAAMVGKPLNQYRIDAAKEGHIKTMNEIAYFGDSDTDMTGLLNNTDITVTASPAGATSSATTIVDMNPDEIIAWFKYFVSLLNAQTRRTIPVTDVLLHSEAYDHIAMTYVSLANGSNSTILELVLKNSFGLQSIRPRFQCSGAAANGTDNRALFYNKNEMNLAMRNPMSMKTFPPERKGFEYTVDMASSTAGVIWYRPVSAMYVDGC